MDQSYKIEDVIEAITITSKNQSQKEVYQKAEKYLVNFEKSQLSWGILPQILNNRENEFTVLHQAALYLKHKLQFDFHQLPQEEYLNLTEILIKYLVNYHEHGITNQLTEAIATLYLFAYKHIGDMLEIVEKTLFEQNNKESIIIDLFKQLAEVAYNKRIVIAPQEKEEYRLFVHNNLEEKVLGLLHKLCESPDRTSVIKFKILDAFVEWAYFANENEEGHKMILENNCLKLALEGMNDSVLSEKSREALCILMKNNKNPEKWPEFYELIFSYLPQYTENCKKISQDDRDHATDYIQLFTDFAKKFIYQIFKYQSPDLIQFLNYLLEMTGSEDSDSLQNLEGFWHKMATKFDRVENENDKETLYPNIAPFYHDLIKIGCKRMVFSQDYFKLIETNKDKNQDDPYDPFTEEIDIRGICGDIIADCAIVLGYQNTLVRLIDLFKETMMQIEDYENYNVVSAMEAMLNAIKICLAEMPADMTVKMNDFLEAIMKIKVESILFNRTKLAVLTNAVKHCEINNDLNEPIFNYIATCLKEESTSERAGLAITIFCYHQSKYVLDNFEDFIKLYEHLDQQDDLGQGLAMACASSEDRELIVKYLAKLCTPIAEKIISSAEKTASNEDKEIIGKIQDHLYKLTEIFDCVEPCGDNEDETSPLEPIFQELWPYIKTMFDHFKKVPEVIRYLCKVIKRGLKKIGIRFRQIAKEFFKIVILNFPEYPAAPYLYTIELCASTFGKCPDMLESLHDIYQFVCKSVYNYFESKNIDDNPEILEDFFGILFRYTKFIPDVLVVSETLEMNMKMALLVIGSNHKHLNKALYLFVERLFKNANADPQDQVQKIITQQLVETYGQQFYKKLMLEYLQYPREAERDYILGIFFAGFARLKQYAFEWLVECFKEVPQYVLTIPEKEQLFEKLKKLDHSQINFHKMGDEDKELEIESFTKFCDMFDHFTFRARQASIRERI